MMVKIGHMWVHNSEQLPHHVALDDALMITGLP